MYDINIQYFGQQIKYYRKLNGLSMQKLGNTIYKSKATIAKYENGFIIPDISTVLSLCNALNIKFEQLVQQNQKNNIQHISIFGELNLYYYTGSKLIFSKIIILEDGTAKLYNDIENNIAKYTYSGQYKSDSSNVFFRFSSDSNKIEEVSISYNPPWSNISNYTYCFISGITSKYIPVIKKSIISKETIAQNILQELLQLNKSEIKKISTNKEWKLH